MVVGGVASWIEKLFMFMCHLSSRVLFWNEWRKKTEGNRLTQVHLENKGGVNGVEIVCVVSRTNRKSFTQLNKDCREWTDRGAPGVSHHGLLEAAFYLWLTLFTQFCIWCHVDYWAVDSYFLCPSLYFTNFLQSRALQPMATYRQSPYFHKPAIIIMTSFSLWRHLLLSWPHPALWTNLRTDTLPRLIYKDVWRMSAASSSVAAADNVICLHPVSYPVTVTALQSLLVGGPGVDLTVPLPLCSDVLLS